ncbi:c-type cytochrome [Flavobacteriaceae bacterium F89]|uniref:C-type cytochrome n=1 Tax=Cerina litoralis TaxID=2874477 RepID=A0AAE3JM13_9FLAO|nr:c-type cytochrome [Cerina litoralis]MCG2459270.1 c-type cytochrome [Cerina litoralis]
MKRKILFKKIVLALVVLMVLIIGTVYLWSTLLLYKTYSIVPTAVQLPVDSASLREGARLTRIAHCGGCHGEDFTGRVFEDIDPKIATLVAPNLTQLVPKYTDGELVRVIRYGIKKNGHSVYIMPAFMYHELKEESVAKIIAFLRTLKPEPDSQRLPNNSSFTFKGRLSLIKGQLAPIADMITPNTRGQYIPRDTTKLSFGKYLTMSTCTSCHGTDLKGEIGFSPNLIIAAAYTREDLFKLLRTGVALGNRKLPLMSEVTKYYLSHLNDNEINCIYDYLQTKPTIENKLVDEN